MLSRIIAGVDGSVASLAAARMAAAEAVAGHRPLRLVHARLPVADYALLLPPGIAADTRAAGRTLVEAVRDALRRRHPDLEVCTVVAESTAAGALLRASRSAGLLVVGRSGLNTTRRGPAGSTAARVAVRAACPVMVVGPVPPDRDEVVLGFDPEEPDAPAVPFAFAAAHWRGAGLRICCVRQFENDQRPDDATARRAVHEAIAGWRATYADVPVAVDVLTGLDPVARLLDASHEAGLVVIGDRDLGVHPATAAPGHLAEVLVRNAASPVAVVRPPRRHARRVAALP
ncbi:universal stress protein [Dactylosporangium vinaceum]|uniref:Universal stress protein n=1 Tax=Dactylosporangium vinaceum TaxID=53362 RepID=A0ABV5MCY1_9ACTN|nr:universal stress protein [Dactylosporangium vinaceum]UAC00763.1 universal stress protein [Dactylosporangium vinaceum]